MEKLGVSFAYFAQAPPFFRMHESGFATASVLLPLWAAVTRPIVQLRRRMPRTLFSFQLFPRHYTRSEGSRRATSAQKVDNKRKKASHSQAIAAARFATRFAETGCVQRYRRVGNLKSGSYRAVSLLVAERDVCKGATITLSSTYCCRFCLKNDFPMQLNA